MKRLIPILSAGALVLPTLALAQDDKEQSCAYQAQVVTAIQEARKDRVRERDLAQAIADSEPDWPEFFNVIKGNGPCNVDRLKDRVSAWDDGAWVREGLLAHARKKAARKHAAE